MKCEKYSETNKEPNFETSSDPTTVSTYKYTGWYYDPLWGNNVLYIDDK